MLNKEVLGFSDRASISGMRRVARNSLRFAGQFLVVAEQPRMILDPEDISRIIDQASGRIRRFAGALEAAIALPFLRDAYPGEQLWRQVADNLVVDEGINSVMDNGISGQTWYLGLKATGAVAAGDTAAQIGGTNAWTEITDYDEATRPAWGEGAASGKAVTNASAVAFSINASVTIFGLFAVSNATKASTSGTLLSAADFTGGSQALTSGSTINVTYTINGSSS